MPLSVRLLCCLLLIGFGGRVSAQTAFLEGSFDQILKIAAELHKPVLVYTHAPDCGRCALIKRNTLDDRATGTLVNAEFVPMAIDVQTDFGIRFAMKYRVSALPQCLIFDSLGQLLARIPGPMGPEAFVAALRDALLPQNALPPTEDPLNFDLPYPDFLWRSYAPGRDKDFPSESVANAYLATRADLTDEVSWAVISRFVSGGTYAEKAVELRDVLIAKYGENEVNDKLASFVFARVRKAIKDSSRSVLAEALDEADLTLGDAALPYRLRYQMYFEQMTGDWAGYAETARRLINGYPDEAPRDAQIDMARNILAYSNSKETLGKAADWMRGLSESDSTSAALETYAGLLYALGRKSDALDAAQNALKAAEKEGVDTQSIEQLISKTKALKP